jgi:hypothetical protein
VGCHGLRPVVYRPAGRLIWMKRSTTGQIPHCVYLCACFAPKTRANDKDQIFFYEKGRGGAKKLTSIKKVAKENGFYSERTEKELNSIIECHANPVLDKIRDRDQQQPKPDEKIKIAWYMANMIRRVPRGWERLQNIAQNPERICSDIEANWPHLHSELEELRQDLRHIPDEWKNNFPRHLWDWSLVNYLPLQVIHILSRMTWRFYVSDKPAFLTSGSLVMRIAFQGR